MAVSLGDIVVRFLADTTELVAGVEESKGLLGNFGGIAAGVGIAAGAAMVGIGVESVKMAGDFQQSLTQLVTGAGESQKNLGMVGDGIKQISVESATSTKALTDGMYMIESAGFHGAAGLDVLKASAQGARTGNANLATAANAVTTVMTDYSNKHYTATEAMNALIATERVGKTHLEDLGRSMGAVLPLASSLGISFPQVAGAMAVMTNSGMTARLSATNLANAIRSLAAPNAVAVNSMQAVGLSAQQLKDTLSTQGLSGAIKLVEEHVGKTFPAGSVEAVQAFKNIMGGATGYGVAIKLGGDHMKVYEANIKSIGSALTKNASDVEGFALVQQNLSFQLDRAKMAGNALMITLGQALLPVLTRLLEAVTPMIVQFTDWESRTHGIEVGMADVGAAAMTVATTIATVVGFFQKNQLAADLLIGSLAGLTAAIIAANASAIIATITAIPAVVVGFGAWAVAAGAAAIATLAAAAPFIAIGIAVALVVAGIILAIQHWGEITKFLQGIWAGFTSWFMGALGQVGAFFHTLMDTINGWTKAGLSTLQGAWQATVGWLGARWNELATAAGVVWGGITRATTAQANAEGSAIQTAWNATAAFTTRVWNAIATSVASAWRTISGIIGGAWNTYIAGPLGGLWSRFTGWFGNLAGMAVQWGANLISAFGRGIVSSLGALGNSLGQAAGTVTKFLGFHSPPSEGPARDADKWAPNLIKMYAGGLAAGIPQIASASSALIAPVGPRLSTASEGMTLGSARGQPVQIVLEIDGQQISSLIAPHLDRHVRLKFGPRGRG